MTGRSGSFINFIAESALGTPINGNYTKATQKLKVPHKTIEQRQILERKQQRSDLLPKPLLSTSIRQKDNLNQSLGNDLESQSQTPIFDTENSTSSLSFCFLLLLIITQTIMSLVNFCNDAAERVNGTMNSMDVAKQYTVTQISPHGDANASQINSTPVIRYGSGITPQTARLLQQYNPNMTHTSLVKPEKTAESIGQDIQPKQNTVQHAVALSRIVKLGGRRSDYALAQATPQTKEVLQQMLDQPSRVNHKSTMARVTDARIIGPYVLKNQSTIPTFKTTEEANSYYLGYKSTGVRPDVLEYTQQMQERDGRRGRLFYQNNERLVAEPDVLHNLLTGDHKYVTKRQHISELLPGQKSLVEHAGNIPDVTIKAISASRKKITERKLRNPLDEGQSTLLHGLFDRTAEIALYALRTLQEVIIHNRTIRDQYSPVAESLHEAQQLAGIHEKIHMDNLSAYTILVQRQAELIGQYDSHFIKNKTTGAQCLTTYKNLTEKLSPTEKSKTPFDAHLVATSGMSKSTQELDMSVPKLLERFQSNNVKKFSPYNKPSAPSLQKNS